MKRIVFLLFLALCSSFVFGQKKSPFTNVKIKKHSSVSIAYSYDGHLLASGGFGELVVLDVSNDSLVHRITTNGGAIIDVKFSPDGYFLATASQDGVVRVFTIEKGLLDRRLTFHELPVTSLDFSPDGKYLVVGSADKTASVWDMWRNIKVADLKGHEAEISGVSFSPKGDLLATCSFDGTMKLWDVNGEAYKEVLNVRYGKKNREKGRLKCVRFDPDGEKIAIASQEGTIRVFDVENQNISLFLRGHSDEVYDLSYSSDGKYLFSSGEDGTLVGWDTETGERPLILQRASAIKLSVRHQGDKVAMADIEKSAVGVKYLDISGLDVKAPPFKSIFVNSHDQKINYLRPKKIQVALPKEKPIIALIQPVVNADGTPVKTTEPIIRIKGTVKSNADIHHFSVNGFEIPIIQDSTENFSYDVKLAYGDNTLEIRAVDVYENEQTHSIKVQRYIKYKGVTDHFDKGRKGTDYALFICTDKYKDNGWDDLDNPIKDGRSIERRLKDIYGFETEFMENPSKSEIYYKIREYNKKVFADDDQLLIFIAGHGSYDEIFEEGYVVATNSLADDEIKESYISYSNLKNLINNIPCDHTFVGLDVCFGGTFDKNIASNSSKSNRGYALPNSNIWAKSRPTDFSGNGEVFDDRIEFIDKRMKKKSRLFISSGGKEYVPDSDGSGHSPFCSHLLEALDSKGGKNGILTYRNLYGMIEIANPTPVQGSFGSNEYGSDFLFINKNFK